MQSDNLFEKCLHFLHRKQVCDGQENEWFKTTELKNRGAPHKWLFLNLSTSNSQQAPQQGSATLCCCKWSNISLKLQQGKEVPPYLATESNSLEHCFLSKEPSQLQDFTSTSCIHLQTCQVSNFSLSARTFVEGPGESRSIRIFWYASNEV